VHTDQSSDAEQDNERIGHRRARITGAFILGAVGLALMSALPDAGLLRLLLFLPGLAYLLMTRREGCNTFEPYVPCAILMLLLYTFFAPR
jgi:hypothetical protein